MSRAERLKARRQMYLIALGPLNLRREELWTVTNGELADMIEAYRYRQFCAKQEQAQHTVSILNAWSKNKITVQDFTGIWRDGRVLSKEEFFEAWKAEHKRRKEAKLSGKI